MGGMRLNPHLNMQTPVKRGYDQGRLAQCNVSNESVSRTSKVRGSYNAIVAQRHKTSYGLFTLGSIGK